MTRLALSSPIRAALSALVLAITLAACSGTSNTPPGSSGNPATSVATWSKSFGGDGDDIASGVTRGADGGYLFVGQRNGVHRDGTQTPWAVPNSESDLWVVKLDDVGDVIWEKTLGSGTLRSPTASISRKYDLAVTLPDGGAWLIGNQDNTASGGGRDIVVARVDAAGSPTWVRSFDSAPYPGGASAATDDDLGPRPVTGTIGNPVEDPLAAVATADGGLLLMARVDSNVEVSSAGQISASSNYILKLRADGTQDWSFHHRLGPLNGDSSGSAVLVEAPNGRALVIVRDIDGDAHAALIGPTANRGGTILRETVLTRFSPSSGVALTRTGSGGPTDDGFVIVGQRDWFSGLEQPFGKRYDGAMFRLTPDGDTEWVVEMDHTESVRTVAADCATRDGNGRCSLVFMGQPSIEDDGTSPNEMYVERRHANGEIVERRTIAGLGREPCSLVALDAGGFLAVRNTDTQSKPLTLNAALEVTSAHAAEGAWRCSLGGIVSIPKISPASSGRRLIFDPVGGWTAVMKNADGSDLWRTNAELPGGTTMGINRAVAVIATDDDGDGAADDGYLIAAESDNTSDVAKLDTRVPAQLIKLNVAGEVVWQREFPDLAFSWLGLGALDVITQAWRAGTGGTRTADGFAFAAGFRDPQGAGTVLVRLAPDGSTRWTSGPFTHTAYSGSSIAAITATADGGFAMTGGLLGDFFRAPQQSWIVRIDSEGAVRWQHSLGGGATSIRELPSGEFIVAGIGDDDPFAMKLAADGAILWSRIYDFELAFSNRRGFATPTARIAPTRDGFVLGTTISPMPRRRPLVDDEEQDFFDFVVENRADNIVLLKLGADGRTQWQRSYGGLLDDGLTSLSVLPDDGILVGGYSDSLGVRREAWVFRLGANGAAAASCNAQLDSNAYGPPTDFERRIPAAHTVATPAADPPAARPGALRLLATAGTTSTTAVARQCSGSYDNAPPASPIPQNRLRVALAGTSQGVITSVPAGIVCGTGSATGCEASFPAGLTVSLSVDPLATARLESWQACDRTPNNRCEVLMNADRNVTAVFRDSVTFGVTILAGQGRVTGDAGIDCVAGIAGRCGAATSAGSTLHLTAVPAPARQFTGWGGACTAFSTRASIEVTMDASKTCTASFTGPPPGSPLLSITTTPAGVGRVMSNPVGIACSRATDRCIESFATGTELTLTATATTPGWEFERFLCNGNGGSVYNSSMSLQLTGNVDCLASFGQGGERLHAHLLYDGLASSTPMRIHSTPAGLDCRQSCDRPFQRNEVIELRAENSTSHWWRAWHGCDAEVPNGAQPPICRVTMNTRRDVYAVLNIVHPGWDGMRSVAVAFAPGSNGGRVTSIPASIDCTPADGICSRPDALGTTISLYLELGANETETSHDGCDTYTPAANGQPARCDVQLLQDRLVTFGVARANGAPNAAFDYLPSSPVVGQPIVLDASASSDDTGIVAYRWDFTDNGVFDAAGITQSVTFPTVGDRTVRLQVEDVDGTLTDLRRTLSVSSGASRLVNVVKGGSGTGAVTSIGGATGIACGLDCEESYPEGSRIELLAVPDAGNTFGGWSATASQCNGGITTTAQGEVCIINVGTSNVAVSALFQTAPVATAPLTVAFAGLSGPGSITSSPAGITCTDLTVVGCTGTFTLGSSVTLTFASRAGSSFVSQTGCDAFVVATSQCRVDLTAARTITVNFAAATGETRWRQVGLIAASGPAGLPIVARGVVTDAQGRAVFAYRDGSGLVHVMRWDGSAWVDVGGAVNTTANAVGTPSLDLDASGNPVVAWDQGPINQRDVRVAAWNGSAWVGVGAGALDDDIAVDARQPSIKVGANGPVVAWAEGDRVIVKGWNGTAWTNFGTNADDGPANGDGAAQPSLSLGPDGTPYVAWAQYANFPNEGVFVAHGTSAGWTTLGGVVSPPAFSDLRTLPLMQLAVGQDGAPVVAYSGFAIGVGVEVRRWNGSAWNLLGGAPVESSATSRVQHVALNIARGTDQPLVTWCDRDGNNMHTARFEGATWTRLGETQMTCGSLVGLGNADAPQPLVMTVTSGVGTSIQVFRYGPP